jgi:hypothetical protein
VLRYPRYEPVHAETDQTSLVKAREPLLGGALSRNGQESRLSIHTGGIGPPKDRIRREQHRQEERQHDDERQEPASQRMHHGSRLEPTVQPVTPLSPDDLVIVSALGAQSDKVPTHCPWRPTT